MSRVDFLVEARDNPTVKFKSFINIASKNEENYAVFFEGEDEKYYSIRINNICPGIKWTGIKCGGKSNVIFLREKIRKHTIYCNSRCIFFVDSDFDDNSSIANFDDVYVTPCYSIENLFISDAAFKRVLSAEFGINESSENNECYLNALNFFKKTKKSYINDIAPFNFLARELRLMESSKDLNGRLNINNIKLKSLVKINLGSTEKKYNENDVFSIFPEIEKDTVINLEASKFFFKKLSGELYYRGKQHLDFFRVFLDHLKEDICKKDGRHVFKMRGSTNLQLSKRNCISELSQYADTPDCLNSFLVKLTTNL